MYIPDVELHESESLEQAAELLGRYGPDARVLAGGTDLLVDLKTERSRTTHLVSIGRIASLRGVTLEPARSGTGHELRIGALTTIAQLAASPLVRRHFAPLLDATREMASPQVRNLATVGGNIASAVPCADLPPILMVLRAALRIWASGTWREVPLEAFFRGPRRTILRPQEVLAEIRVPLMPAGFGAAYARFALRDGNAIAVAAVAAGLSLTADNIIAQARIVLGAVAPTPALAAPAAEALVGQAPDEDSFEQAAAAAMRCAAPISDVRGSAEFRRKLVGVLTRRALAAARDRARDAKAKQ